jgi:hypothetical protein
MYRIQRVMLADVAVESISTQIVGTSPTSCARWLERFLDHEVDEIVGGVEGAHHVCRN